jgi:hypothetical protein
MSGVNLLGGSAGENIALFHFNFDPSLDPTQLAFTAVSDAAAVPNAINAGANAFQADGDGHFDIQFDFPPPPGSGTARFTGGETVVYDLTYTSPIDVNSFNYSSEMGGGNGSFLAAAHILRTPNGGNDSAGSALFRSPATAAPLGRARRPRVLRSPPGFPAPHPGSGPLPPAAQPRSRLPAHACPASRCLPGSMKRQ